MRFASHIMPLEIPTLAAVELIWAGSSGLGSEPVVIVRAGSPEQLARSDFLQYEKVISVK